jgi:putative ABC transport system permease protein
MLKSYIKIALRNLRNKITFSFINITGLAVGMAGAILIFAWVQNEYSYDTFHANENTLYKVWYRYVTPGYIGTQDVTCSPVGKALKDEYPEIKNSARVYWSTDRLFNYGDKFINAKGNDVDKPFLAMFTFPLLEGNAAHALDDINNIVITKKLATKLFGNADPINKLVKINNKDLYRVSGVLKDLPNNTQFDFEYLVSLRQNVLNDNSWNANSYYTYVQLQPNANINKVNTEIKNIAKRHDPKNSAEIFLYPFSKMHLYSRFDNGKAVGGRIEIVHLLLAIAGIILLIACINFMNLSTAQSQKRAKEVGVRKVVGASRISLISQFLSESIIIAFIAGIISLLIVTLCLPAFNQLTEKSLGINYASPIFWLALIGFIVFTGLLAGSYPAFLLSGFRPVKVLKGSNLFTGGANWFNPRKVLVVLQFSVAIILVISTIVIYRQIKFAQNRDTGYNITNLIEVPIEGNILKNYNSIKNDLLNSGVATATCKTSYTVTLNAASASGYKWDGMQKEQESLSFTNFGTAGDFIKTMGLKLIEGRDIDFNAYPSDSTACLLNETAVAQMGIKNPVGKFIHTTQRPIKIVGVFKDFIIQSPYANVDPMIVFGSKDWAYNMVIRLNSKNDVAKNLQTAGQILKKYNPAYPFTYQFIDREYQQKFNDQQQTGTLAFVFAGLTIFISCLGLFGLASYMAENRSKEIGIRKVLGASVAGIAQMLTREFVALVVIAIVIATPVAWWAMSKWLQDFTYRIHIGWLTFVIAGLVAIIIAVLTVSTQSVKAAMANPVKSIKME